MIASQKERGAIRGVNKFLASACRGISYHQMSLASSVGLLAFK